jgi:hypothetical protein
LGQITAIAEWRGFIQGLETLEHFDFGDLERNHELEGRLVMDASKWLKYFLGGLAYQVVVTKKRVQIEVERSGKD